MRKLLDYPNVKSAEGLKMEVKRHIKLVDEAQSEEGTSILKSICADSESKKLYGVEADESIIRQRVESRAEMGIRGKQGGH